MRIQISEIKVNPGRRTAAPERVAELAKSIAEIGLLNPVTLDRANTLIAGLHRLEAAKLLGWDEIDYTVSSLEGLRAELAEIDENFVRTDLSAIEYGDLLLRRKEIYEALHPETRAGAAQAAGMNRAVGNNVTCKMHATSKSFVDDTAEKLGVNPSTVRRQVQTAKNMTPEAKAIIRDSGTRVTKKDAMKLSRLEPEQQKDAASQLAAREIRSMAEYQPLDEPEPQEPAMEEPAAAPPPFKLSEQQFTSFKESVAALKDTEKDFSCTPDSFLAEITAFVRKFHWEIEWYGTPYLSRIFPAYGVRFIAINDNIDTANEHAGDDLNISMRNLINDAYCHDISVKTRSALLVKRKNGDYVGACPVYGYRKSEENRNQLVVDEYAARVVRDIFRAKIDGRSAKKIADELNALGVLSPLAYKVSRGLPHPTGGFADRHDAKWSATTVIRILQDETYTGTLIQGRLGTHNHKVKNIIHKPAEEWIRVENAHEPIIRKADFDLVQNIMSLDTRAAPDGENVYLFSGLLVCGCCGARMTRKTNTVGGKKYIYYHCPTGKKRGCTHPVMLREDELTQCVLESVQAHIRNVASLEALLDSISEDTINQELIDGCRAQVIENNAQLEQITLFKAGLYENFVKGLLTKMEYKDLRDKYTEHMEQLREANTQLRQEMDCAADNTYNRLKWTRQFHEFSNLTELDRRAVVTLIQSIVIISKTELRQHRTKEKCDIIKPWISR